MIVYSPPSKHIYMGREFTCENAVIQDWHWYDYLIAKYMNILCNKICLLSRRVGLGDIGLRWFCGRVHVPISKWYWKRTYCVIYKPNIVFEHGNM